LRIKITSSKEYDEHENPSHSEKVEEKKENLKARKPE